MLRLLRTGVLLIICCTAALIALGQDHTDLQLARQFAEQAELQKAAELFKKLSNRQETFFEIYEDYQLVLQQLEDTKAEEALIEKAYLLAGKDPVYLFDLAMFYDRAGDNKNADKTLTKALGALKQNAYQIHTIARKLIDAQKYEWAKAVYLKGKQIFKSNEAFELELAHISGLQGDFNGMVTSFIQHAINYPGDLPEIINALQSATQSEEQSDLLEGELLRTVGKNKEAWPVIELLIWLYQKKDDYESALEQLRSLDLLKDEDGSRVMELARIALRQKDYRTAIKAYQYVVGKGKENPYYVTASLELITARKEQILQQKQYTREQVLGLKQAYLDFIAGYYNVYTSAAAQIELADLEARYLYELDSAIILLQKVLNNRDTPKDLLVRAKLALGDYYIMNNEHWESTLLYTQVEKEYKGTPTGEEAKFRNARLAYFKGDFDWALTQLKVIKGNTFELISNDAIELAVFISDNYNQDYEEDKQAMKTFSQVNLLSFQNKLEEADKLADMMLLTYTGHPIEDDIYYIKARIARQRQQYDNAVQYLTRITDDFSTSIMADDAAFQLAELYEYQFNDKSKAMEWYEKILLEYPDSTYTIDARKRYRRLRGDTQ